jgi:ABC-2 type transport system permease protein
VTAHEVAHQWWAHQVIGGDVQGSTVLSETLSQYSALMVMEKEYGRDQMRKFLEYELDRYLSGRGTERHKELPLMRVENQAYIHYNKGSLVMYALREYMGEDRLNAVLAQYIRDVGFQQPPYTNARELVERIRAAIQPEYAYLVEDLFETITLYDNRTHGATITPTADGRWTVELDVETGKLRADETGAEQSVPLSDWIEVGAFVEREVDGRTQQVPVHLEKQLFTGERSTVSFVVDEKPTRAGIDPRVLLVDRDPDDNVRSVSEG